MTSSYRLIHFTPDPFTGARFPLGALVAAGDGAVQVAKVAQLPSAACLGDRNLAVSVQRLHARLDAVHSIDTLPAVFGPYTTLSERREVPAGVSDPLAWVQHMLSPERPSPDRLVTPRGAQRGSLGYRFFETWSVARYVRKTFRPAADQGGWLGTHAAGLQQITHWAQGEDAVLLMEPVIANRPQLEHDLQEIAARFLAYRYALEKTEEGRRGELIAYLPAGGHADQRGQARETLAAFAHRVVDTDDPVSRATFLHDIRSTGARHELPLDAQA
jgi:hypothetical protein